MKLRVLIVLFLVTCAGAVYAAEGMRVIDGNKHSEYLLVFYMGKKYTLYTGRDGIPFGMMHPSGDSLHFAPTPRILLEELNFQRVIRLNEGAIELLEAREERQAAEDVKKGCCIII